MIKPRSILCAWIQSNQQEQIRRYLLPFKLNRAQLQQKVQRRLLPRILSTFVTNRADRVAIEREREREKKYTSTHPTEFWRFEPNYIFPNWNNNNNDRCNNKLRLEEAKPTETPPPPTTTKRGEKSNNAYFFLYTYVFQIKCRWFRKESERIQKKKSQSWCSKWLFDLLVHAAPFAVHAQQIFLSNVLKHSFFFHPFYIFC